MKLIYLTAAALMVVFAVFMAFSRGWLWGIALLGASAALAFLGLAKEDDDGARRDRY